MLPLGESPSNELYVNMSVSSQTIVNQLLKRPVRHQIQVDFTHDVSVDNLMILMIGISNEGHEYLPIAVVLTSRENEKSVRDWKTEIEGSVESVMADAIYAIYAKFEEARCAIPTCAGNVSNRDSCQWGIKVKQMCVSWFHT